MRRNPHWKHGVLEEAELRMPKVKKVQPKEDIFQLLLETSEKRKKDDRTQLLQSLKVLEFFDEGEIYINARTCQGLECELCIKACPTGAVYWRDGKVGIIDELCVYCGACVLCCIVDDCIRVRRRRKDGSAETFSRPSEVVSLYTGLGTRRRHERAESLFPDSETYLKRYRKL